MWCRCRQDVDWQWVVFGLGSGTWIQIYGDGVKDKLLGLLPCFHSPAPPPPLLPLLAVPQEPLLVPASIPPEEAPTVESTSTLPPYSPPLD